VRYPACDVRTSRCWHWFFQRRVYADPLMRKPFQFSVRTMFGVAALICASTWYLAQCYRRYPETSPIDAMILAITNTIISLLA
jgi:hypothetical protein